MPKRHVKALVIKNTSRTGTVSPPLGLGQQQSGLVKLIAYITGKLPGVEEGGEKRDRILAILAFNRDISVIAQPQVKLPVSSSYD